MTLEQLELLNEAARAVRRRRTNTVTAGDLSTD